MQPRLQWCHSNSSTYSQAERQNNKYPVDPNGENLRYFFSRRLSQSWLFETQRNCTAAGCKVENLKRTEEYPTLLLRSLRSTVTDHSCNWIERTDGEKNFYRNLILPIDPPCMQSCALMTSVAQPTSSFFHRQHVRVW